MLWDADIFVFHLLYLYIKALDFRCLAQGGINGKLSKRKTEHLDWLFARHGRYTGEIGRQDSWLLGYNDTFTETEIKMLLPVT